MSFAKILIKDWVPPALLRTFRKILGKSLYFDGSYKSWEEASALCTGYDAESILDKVLKSTLKVKYGEAVFERDSVIFDEIQYSWPVATALMMAAARNNGKLHVLDFGGSLGSSYFQNIKLLSMLHEMSWSIVEQSQFVSIGKEQIADETLKFYLNIDECWSSREPNIVLLSSVLQYLADPFCVLHSLAQKNAELIVIDRTPFSIDSIAKIKIQHVPADIYSASYPCWFFSRNDFIQKMISLNYRVVEYFDSIDKLSDEAKWQGLIFERVK